jgi:integral membrane sensor domain MASE1
MILKFRNLMPEIKWIILTIMVLPFNYLIFKFLLGSKLHFAIIILSIGIAKILLAFLFIKEKFHFLNLLSFGTHIFLIIGLIGLIIKDAYENNTDVQKLIEEKYNTKIEQNEIIKEDKKIVMPLNINPKNEELK